MLSLSSSAKKAISGRAIAAVATFIGGVLMVACVRFTTEVTYFLVESSGLTTIELSVSRPGICFNLHGGCADTYQFSFPAHLGVVDSGAISSYKVNYAVAAATELPKAGQIAIATTPGGCAVSIHLFSKSGKPLPVNGTFKQARCGQNT